MSKACVQRFPSMPWDIVKSSPTARHDFLIHALTSLIRRWANCHCHVISKGIFSKVNSAIWQCLWRWARRRQANKDTRWVRQKYFRTVGFQHRVFRTETGKMLST
ncbi:group II intron maturase-specific domain-containing protein [Caballeronia sp. SEWSISQ10-4 2]|uniref:group II intron maturase-specific domain-containing protein n=1 Tax=Caballeronia sp. SEWSISQ10-4 2 TaxID=2937438 RepID=UPI0034622233